MGNQLCLCGSGKLYKECCEGKISINQNENIYKMYMQEFDIAHSTYI